MGLKKDSCNVLFFKQMIVMRKVFLSAAIAMALTMAACSGSQTAEPAAQKDTTQAQPAQLELQDVANRTQMGAKIFVTPQPALMIGTYDENGNPDVMMAAWGGQCDNNQVCFRLSPHRTTTNLRATKEFTLSYATQRDVAESDYFGTVSANDVPDKIARAGFTVTKSQNINAPIIDQYPLTMECRVVKIIEREGDGCFVIGEVVNTIADPSILTDGRIDLDKLQPIVFDASMPSYRSVGGVVGGAWDAGKKFIK